MECRKEESIGEFPPGNPESPPLPSPDLHFHRTPLGFVQSSGLRTSRLLLGLRPGTAWLPCPLAARQHSLPPDALLK